MFLVKLRAAKNRSSHAEPTVPGVAGQANGKERIARSVDKTVGKGWYVTAKSLTGRVFESLLPLNPLKLTTLLDSSPGAFVALRPGCPSP